MGSLQARTNTASSIAFALLCLMVLQVTKADRVCALDLPPLEPTPDWRAPQPALDVDKAQPLTLARAIVLAMRHSRSLQISTIAVADALAGREATLRTVFDPQLQGNYNYTVTDADDDDGINQGSGRLSATGRVAGWTIEPFVGFEYQPETADYSSNAGVAFARQLLKWNEGLRQRLAISRANRNIVQAVNNRMIELRNVRLAVTEAYLALQRQQETLRIRNLRVEDAKQFLAEVEAKVTNNLSAPVEQTNAELDVNRAQTDVLQAQTAVQRDLDRLLVLMGVGVLGQSPTVIDKLDVDLPPQLALQEDIVLVTSQHERLSNIAWDMALLSEEIVLAYDDIMPDVTGRVAFGYDATGSEPLSNDDTSAAEAVLGLELRLPLDNWRTERARYRQRRLAYDDTQLDFDRTRVELERDLRQQARDYDLQTARVALIAARVQAETDKLAATLRQYEVGAIDNLEVSRAKRALDDAKVSLLGARVDRLRSYARYVALLPAENAPPMPPPSAMQGLPE
jgi:outer membrane protein